MNKIILKKDFFDLAKKLDLDCIRDGFKLYHKVLDVVKKLDSNPISGKTRCFYDYTKNNLLYFNINQAYHIYTLLGQNDILDSKEFNLNEKASTIIEQALYFHYNKLNDETLGMQIIVLLNSLNISKIISNTLTSVLETTLIKDQLHKFLAANAINQIGKATLEISFLQYVKTKAFFIEDFIQNVNIILKLSMLDDWKIPSKLLNQEKQVLFFNTLFLCDNISLELKHIFLLKYLHFNLNILLKIWYQNKFDLTKILPLFELLLKNQKRTLKANKHIEFIYELITILESNLTDYEIILGKEYITILVDSKLISVEKSVYNFVSKRFDATGFIFNALVLDLKQKLIFPSLDEKLTSTEINFSSNLEINVNYDKNYDIKNDNRYMKGVFKEDNKKIYQEVLGNSFFEANVPFLITLFTLLNTFKDKTKDRKLILNALSEIYKFNFNLDLSQMPGMAEIIINYALDFNNKNKLDLQTDYFLETNFNKAVFYEFKVMLNNIINHIYSYKLFLINVLKSLVLIVAFDKFCFPCFLDTRGRLYYQSNFINPQHTQLVRNTISFVKESLEFKNLSDNKKSELKLVLETQLKSILNEEISYIENLSLEDILENKKIKLGDKFRFFILLNDFKQFQLKRNMEFKGYFSVDAICSGMQCLSLFLKSSKLAHYCLNDTETDIYTEISTYRKNKLILLLKLTKNISQELLIFLTNGRKIKLNLCETNLIENKTLKKNFNSLSKKIQNSFFSEQENLIKSSCLAAEFTYLENEFISIYFLKKSKKQFLNFIQTYKLLEQLLRIQKIFDEIPWLFDFFISRSATKTNVMTHAYGSSFFGKTIQIKNAVLKFCFNNGFLLKNKYLKSIYLISNILTKILNNWFQHKLPEFTLFFNAVNKNCSEKVWGHNYVVNLGHFEFIIKPMKENSKRISIKIDNKNHFIGFKIAEKSLQVNYKKLGSSFTANYIQALDSSLLYFLFKKIYSKNKISIFTIHDSFHVHPIDASTLLGCISESYLELFKLNLLETNFKDDFPAIYKKIKEIHIDQLQEKTVLLSKIVKH